MNIFATRTALAGEIWVINIESFNCERLQPTTELRSCVQIKVVILGSPSVFLWSLWT